MHNAPLPPSPMSPRARSLSLHIERWPLAAPFRITGHVIDTARLVRVTVDDGHHAGHGEASGVFYLGETPESIAAQIERVRPSIEAGATRAQLLDILPPGGARNAVDAALWALESQRQAMPVWRIAGLCAPRPLRTTMTIGVDTPNAMAGAAQRLPHARALKVKLDGSAADAARLSAIREVRPDIPLAVDANQGWSRAHFDAMLPVLQQLDVCMLEQPFAIGADACLEHIDCPIPLAADESFQDLGDLSAVARRYDIVNLKLDKCGGLTRALGLAAHVREAGLSVMVGCMAGTSLAIAPAFLLGQQCDHVDLDGPIFLARDREPGVAYIDGLLHCPPLVWDHADITAPSR
ncbi:dipeptide epimerase [Burkholderia cepacia]|uniref:Dipeptide epimerase n=2 Tax=Burkholderia cepacia TaxID=292 RepID=A0A8I1DN51_BURCE|nr:dipeptide epimerase [Burkholderia cepacia]MBA9899753.1 dipeptide epimerase [Burkholderia cepacia]MBA9943433.1 dipeptide epimerase [Burkholderia cepacia]MBA9973331.1 dipeptide epimerase [Burkholderia cepacia]MBA9991903.1 dipeptide epimerase [Burkholderia cepacia]MBB0002105.1 dipeptide epimerase [Burkholderia cepacia]